MSILSALKEKQHDNKNLDELAKLPQAYIIQMGQRKDLTPEEVAIVTSKKAQMIEDAVRQKALAQTGGGQLPTVMEQKMAQIAQAENPAAQLPEEVGIAQNPVPPMTLAGGGIIAFDDGGDVEVDPEEDYQDLIDQAKEDEINDEIFGIIAAMEGSKSSPGGFGIKAERRDSGDMADRLRAQIMSKESGGRRYDKNGNLLTSSKGAQGEMQVMPGTARDPGFGIKPAQNSHPDELRRVGDEYANVLLSRYRDPKLAMIAYNMGPGATDKWLASGADISKLPKETQGYIRGVNLAQGGEVKHYAGTTDGSVVEEEPTSVFERLFNQKERLKEYEDKLAKQREFEKVSREQPGLFDKTTKAQRSKAEADLEAANRARSGLKALAPAKVVPPTMPDELRNAPIANAPAPIAVPLTEPQQKAEEEAFNLMQYIRDRQARADKQSEKDKWQAGLAAGLGMLGGTSQYWQENIGKGGQMGVQQLANLQKLRASQDIATDKLMGSAANQETLNKFRKEQLSQQGPIKYAGELDKVRQGRLTLEEKYLKQPKYLSLATIDSVRDRLSKDPNNKELQTQYNNLMNLEKDLRSRIKKEYPDPNPAYYGVKGPSNVIKLD